MSGTNESQLDKFLTPEAMLTPGAAGGVTTVISNALYVNFGLPPAHIGLILSFLFGLLVMVSPKQLWAKLIYYLLNSLVIFCVAFGAGHLAPPGGGPTAKDGRASAFFSTAYAQPLSAKDRLAGLRAEYTDLAKQYEEASAQLSKLQSNGGSQEDISAISKKVANIQYKMSKNLSEQQDTISQIEEGLNQRVPAYNAQANPWQNPFGGPCSIFRSPFGGNC